MMRVLLIVAFAITLTDFKANGGPIPTDLLHEEELSGYKDDAIHTRLKRAFRSYFYNYLDEIAMSVCASIQKRPGLVYAVRRTAGEKDTCKDICTEAKLRKQAAREWWSKQWSCTESLHVFKRSPTLGDNYEDDTDSHKLGLSIYRHYSCTVGGAGPNYCCCSAT